MGPEWAVACAVAAALPDAGELDFAVFRSTAKEPGRIARFFGNEASFWVMAIELAPRARAALLPDALRGGRRSRRALRGDG